MDATCGAGPDYPSRSHDFLSDVLCDARSLVLFVVLLYIIVSPFALLYCMFFYLRLLIPTLISSHFTL